MGGRGVATPTAPATDSLESPDSNKLPTAAALGLILSDCAVLDVATLFDGLGGKRGRAVTVVTSTPSGPAGLLLAVINGAGGADDNVTSSDTISCTATSDSVELARPRNPIENDGDNDEPAAAAAVVVDPA